MTEKKQNFGIIMRKFDYPVRMCIICKSRLLKSNLFRYQINQGKITTFSGSGRSFYICATCLDKEKKLKKIFNEKCTHTEENWGKKLKEIVTKWSKK